MMSNRSVLVFLLVCVAGVVSAVTTGVSELRLERLSRGANVSQWFHVYSPQPDSHYREYMNEAEMQAMRGMGLRHVRLCVAPNYLYDPEHPAVPIAEHVATLKAAVLRFNRCDMAVVIDIHGPKQYQDDAHWVAGFAESWGAVAGNFRDVNADMLFFEILNEPVFDKQEQDWATLQEKVVAAIRRSAPEHTIIATGPNWGGIDGLMKMKPLADVNIVYSFHFYDPFTFTHQGATWAGNVPPFLKDIPYPSTPELAASALAETTNTEARAWIEKYGNERWNKDKLQSRMSKVQAWSKENGVSLYCGEFGVYPKCAPAASRERWFADYAEVLKESGIGWAVWCWDDTFGFDRKYKDGKLVIDPVPVKALGLKPI